MSLGKVICESSRVVHVTMCKQNVIYGNDLIRGFANIETHIQLRYRYNSFLAGD